MSKQDIYNADHPARQKAIQIIEQIIEPFCNKIIDGKDYYNLEDKLTFLINS